MIVSLIFVVDLVIVVTSAVAAILLRENLTFTAHNIVVAGPYLFASLLAACIILPASGVSKGVWRYTGFDDLLRIFIAAVAIGASAAGLTFIYNGLEGVPRSIPILHVILFTGLACAPRAIKRLRYNRRRQRVRHADPSLVLPQPERVLVVGVNAVSELFLRAARDFTYGGIRVLGVLSESNRYRGRTFSGVPVIGSPDELSQILQQMQVHGADVQRIVISVSASELPDHIVSILSRLEAGNEVSVEYLSERLNFARVRNPEPSSDRMHAQANLLPSLQDMLRLARPSRHYWRIKRLFDVLASLTLLVITAPLMVIVAILVAIDVGSPVMFWQERLGIMGRRLRINKFRTMRPAYNSAGERIPEQARTSTIGAFLRRTRLDELPQLFHILCGDMSFIGPRPLLYAEQELAYAARLAIRPGLTGWAQVHGGREISVSDKVAMDLWYIRNASLRLDVTIALKTALMLVRGDQPDPEVITMAWREVANVRQ